MIQPHEIENFCQVFGPACEQFESMLCQLGGETTAQMDHGQVEALIFCMGMELLRCLLQGYLDLRCKREEQRESVLGSDSILRTHCRRDCTRTLMSRFDEVVVKRRGYSARGARSLFPLQRPSLPVMASGGIEGGHDAAEFILLGAPVVQVCTTVMLRGFSIIGKMKQELQEFMEWHEFESCAEFIAKCKDSLTEFGSLGISSTLTAVVDLAQCTRCSSCWVSCRDGGYQAISFDDGFPVVHKDKCAGCSLCSHVCPVGAIIMSPGVCQP
ncbi:MAG: 4Fe-4S dicluster-binding protein [Syntrophobacteraceae bacterium]